MYEDVTPESIKAEIVASLTTDMDTREGSYIDTLIGPISLELWKAYTALNAAIPIAFIDETSGMYIDKKCAEVGITRKAGTNAKVTLRFTGTDGARVPSGSVFLTLAGQEFTTLTDAVISVGTAEVVANAEEIGAAYNVPAGSIVNQYNSISGITAVTNPEPASGGADAESDASLVQRYYAYLQTPATSGNIHHYEQWALETPGVGAVKVTPLENGHGTVGVLIVGPQKQPVDNAIVTACATHIEENRPIGPVVTVSSAEGLLINVTATVSISQSTTASLVHSAFSVALDTYLKSIAFVKYELLYNQVSFLLMGIDGVEDFTNLQINGAAENITIAAKQVPLIGVVEVSA